MFDRRGRGASIRGRFVLVVLLSTIPFFIAVSLTTFIISINARNQLQKQIENSTATLHDLIDSMLKSSVHSYLRSKIETGIDLVYNSIESQGRPPAGEYDTELLRKRLLSLRVGDSGYFYAVDSRGTVIFHPDPVIVGTDQRGEDPVDRQLARKQGYLEYEWQNTFEDQPQKKALYMSYIPELDWILTATSYRHEFTYMIDRDTLEDTVYDIRVGESGYSYIFDRDGFIIAHPYLTGNRGDGVISEEEYKAIIDKLYSTQEGFTTYLWKDEASSRMREKLVNVEYLPDFDWVVGTALYKDELNKPIVIVVILNSLIALIAALFLFIVIFRINYSIEKQVYQIGSVLRQSVDGDLQNRAEIRGPSEFREIAKNLNLFIDNLKNKTDNLSSSLKEKEMLIQEIQHRVKNNLQTISSLLNLQKGASKSEAVVSMLRKTQNRINSMAIVYDQILLDSDGFDQDSLRIDRFLESYIASIISSFRPSNKAVEIKTDIEDMYLRRNKAISVGLIINELVTNSIEHAFNGADSGRIDIRLVLGEDGQALLSVRNDGVPREDESAGSAGADPAFGLGLVSVLIEQLTGSSSVSRENGLEYRIRFPV